MSRRTIPRAVSRYAVLLAALSLGGCGSPTNSAKEDSDATSEAAEVDPALLFACGESRGELVALASVTSHQRSLNAASLSTEFLTQLADAADAPESVRADLALWGASHTQWHDDLRALPPRMEGGRLIEPDFAPLDQRFVTRMLPVGKRLGLWVRQTCGPCGQMGESVIAAHVGDRLGDVCPP